MSEIIDNLDDLEALLAELNDSDLEELSEPKPAAKKPEPEPEPEPVKEAEVELDDLDVLSELDDLDDPVEQKPEPQPEPEPEPEPENVIAAHTPTEEEEVAELSLVEEGIGDETDEVDALIAAASAEPANPAPRREEPNQDVRFVPETELRTFIDPDRLSNDLAFTQTNISLAMTRQASLFAHYSMLAHQAQFQADRADQQVDLIEAQLDQTYRDAFTTAGVKVTENAIKAAIIKDSKYQKAVLRKNEAKAIAEMVKSAADSFRHRRDMLIQVGADLRQEAQGAVRTKEHPGKAALERMR